MAVKESNGAEQAPVPAIQRTHFLGVPFDKITFTDVVALIDVMREFEGFRYVVTPNVDHVVRFSGSRELRACYENAWLTVCDSKPLILLARLMPLTLPRVTGSDLTASLFGNVIRDGDRITIIAPNEAVVEKLRAKYPRLHIRAHVPPFGVGDNPAELARCIEFAVAEKADFVFIAIGAPQSEKIAYAMSKDKRASGICLCVGASLEFITGMKRRAPRWMSKVGIEWMHRLASDPRRLWRRYAFALVPLMRLTVAEFRQRRKVRTASGGYGAGARGSQSFRDKSDAKTKG